VRAVWYDRQGDAADVLQAGELPDPAPGVGEVRVRVRLSGLNPGDTEKRRGWLGSSMPYPRVVTRDRDSGLRRVGAGQGQHLLGHVDAVRMAGRPDPAGGEQDVDPTAGTRVQHPLTLAQAGDGDRVATAEAHPHRLGRQLPGHPRSTGKLERRPHRSLVRKAFDRPTRVRHRGRHAPGRALACGGCGHVDRLIPGPDGR
jgi:hypothetical protein